MKILIIEDDEFKEAKIAEVTQDALPDASLRFARSVNAGMTKIEEERPDVILLDMSLTTFEVTSEEPGGRPQNFGGLEVLSIMQRLGLSIPTIVITQYRRFMKGDDEVPIDHLARELSAEHPESFQTIIYYKMSQGKWKSELRRWLLRFQKGETNDRRDHRRRR